MERIDAVRRENDALRERISRLSAASLRINASLDLDTVLHEVVESARALIGARYGVIAIIDKAGTPQNFVISGFTAEEERRLMEWPDGPRLFQHFRGLPGALRISNLPSYVGSLGYSTDLIGSKTFLGTSMRHRGVQVGSFFLAEKEGAPEFTIEDEEVMVLFASQAVTAIANAQTYRDEQRARADLEALIETSPVGVVVFEARTGEPVSLNLEAKRIVETLITPDQSQEELLKVVTCRRSDGREVTLNDLRHAETLRAEEIVLTVPDGRSVTTLINATPIRGADGTVESVVVTMQDLASLEEMERMRAEFLEMVSHELRAPLTAIKGATATVFDAWSDLELAEMREFFRIIEEQADHMRGLISELLDAGRIDAGILSVNPEPSDVASLVDQARNTYLTGGGRHTVLMDLAPDLPLMMADRRRVVQVLNNLLSNAARHSPASSPIRVAAELEGVHVAVSVLDEGRGVSPDRLPHLFRKYARVGGNDSERRNQHHGLGLTICKGLVEAHGGRIRAMSRGRGQGTTITFTIPVVGGVGDATSSDWVRRRPSPSPEGRARAPILVVDDDPQTLRFVRNALADAGYAALVTGDHRELSQIISAQKPQLVLLDLILPGIDGIELMERVPELADLPVVFISGYGRDETIAKALEMGAADYIVKPFSPTELVARVRAALRRQAGPEPFVLGDLAIYYEEHRVSVAGRPVQLTATEFELLRVLSVNAGRLVTLESLLRQVWGARDSGDAVLVRSFMKTLRRKIGDVAAAPTYIFTERGVGYRMAKPRER